MKKWYLSSPFSAHVYYMEERIAHKEKVFEPLTTIGFIKFYGEFTIHVQTSAKVRHELSLKVIKVLDSAFF